MSNFPDPPIQVGTSTPLWRWFQDVARNFWSIPQYSADPTSPRSGDVWVLYSGGTYQLSYRTKEGTTKRVTLT